ncbi:MAG: hypothetical protein K0R06_2482 [Clostridium sp.]|nr:hypothetical protein [Clostridium sp.]
MENAIEYAKRNAKNMTKSNNEVKIIIINPKTLLKCF